MKTWDYRIPNLDVKFNNNIAGQNKNLKCSFRRYGESERLKGGTASLTKQN